MRNSITRVVLWVRNNIALTFLVTLAAIVHLSIILPSGSHYCFNGFCGDYYWGVQEHDGIWHMAVAETAFKTLIPRNPIFSGLSLSGYNSLLDYVLFIFAKMGISPFFMYFKAFPVIWFMVFTYFAFVLSKKLSKSSFFTFCFLLLSYFGASFSFMIPLIKEHSVKGTSSLLTMQSVLTLTNLQLAFSYIFLFWILILLTSKKKLTKKNLIGLCLLIFLQWGLKFYAGFVSLVIVGVVGLLRLIKSKDKNYLFLIIGIAISSVISVVITYNPFGGMGGGPPFIFKPLALVWPLIEDPGLFYSEYWANAKYTFLASRHFSPRFVLFMSVLIVAFIVLNIGPRILGLVQMVKKIVQKKMKDIDYAIFIAVLLATILVLFFVQKGVWWNTIQFFFFVFLLLNIYTAEFIAEIKNKAIKMILITLIILLSIPYTLDALKSYMEYPGQIYISKNELHALSYVKKLPDGVIYAPIYKPISSVNIGDLKPLYNHVDSAYVSAYTGKQTLYANYVQLDLLNIDYKKRKKQIEQGDCSLINQINYVYFHLSQKNDVFIKKCIYPSKRFKNVFNSGEILIYSKIK